LQQSRCGPEIREFDGETRENSDGFGGDVCGVEVRIPDCRVRICDGCPLTNDPELGVINKTEGRTEHEEI
jgi:hypothetical protein